MKHPVKLPSGAIVDRSSIARALLSDPVDPFTRAPMTLEMVEEVPDLKQKIDEWIQEKMNA